MSFTKEVIRLDFPLPSSPQTQIRTAQTRQDSKYWKDSHVESPTCCHLRCVCRSLHWSARIHNGGCGQEIKVHAVSATGAGFSRNPQCSRPKQTNLAHHTLAAPFDCKCGLADGSAKVVLYYSISCEVNCGDDVFALRRVKKRPELCCPASPFGDYRGSVSQSQC